MFDGRKRRLAAAVVVATATGFIISGTPNATADPHSNDIKTVKAKVDRLFHQAELAADRYDAARQQLRTSRTTLRALNADLRRQQRKVGRMRQGVATMVVRQYQGAALSTASQMVLADNPDNFLDNLNAIAAYNSQRSEAMSRYTVELKRLHLRKAAVSKETRALDRTRDKMAAEKAQIDKKASAAKSELDSLQAEQREQLLAGTYDGPVPTVNASGSAAAAVRYALAQVGKPYAYGAAGPGAFDCSGLTMRAWGAAGVGLPHSSGAQSGMGTPVPMSALRPGDLVFYYHPVSHVGIYIGNGLIVNAENPSVGVRVTGVNSMPVAGARRF